MKNKIPFWIYWWEEGCLVIHYEACPRAEDTAEWIWWYPWPTWNSGGCPRLVCPPAPSPPQSAGSSWASEVGSAPGPGWSGLSVHGNPLFHFTGEDCLTYLIVMVTMMAELPCYRAIYYLELFYLHLKVHYLLIYCQKTLYFFGTQNEFDRRQESFFRE